MVFQARRGGAPEPALAGGLLLRGLQHLHALPEPLETGESPAGTAPDGQQAPVLPDTDRSKLPFRVTVIQM